MACAAAIREIERRIGPWIDFSKMPIDCFDAFQHALFIEINWWTLDTIKEALIELRRRHREQNR